MAGSARENRNFCETDAAAPRGSGHKDAIGALRRLKHDGASVTWDGHESRVSFDAPSGGDQASLECYRKAAVEVDAYLAAELPEFTPAEQRQKRPYAKFLRPVSSLKFTMSFCSRRPTTRFASKTLQRH